MIFCNAIFGVFCLALPMGNTTAQMEYLGIGGVVSVTAQGWSATLSLGTDAPQVLNPTKLAEFCIDGQCIHYWRHCAPIQAEKINCNFSFNEGYTSVTADFIADTQDDADRAAASIGFLRSREKPNDAIALADLKTESPLATPPVCNYYADEKPAAGCPATQPMP